MARTYLSFLRQQLHFRQGDDGQRGRLLHCQVARSVFRRLDQDQFQICWILQSQLWSRRTLMQSVTRLWIWWKDSIFLMISSASSPLAEPNLLIVGSGRRQGVQGGGQAEFDGHVSGVSQINPDIRAAVYRIVTSMGQEEDYNTMVKIHDGAETTEE